MAPRSTPEDGDIVVREETREGNRVYVLHIAPGADQYVLRSREAAVAQAVTFAERESVRAWLTDEGCEFALLDNFRVLESVSEERGITMAKAKTHERAAVAADRAPKSRAATFNDRDVARRAYDLYLARGCEPGHDVEDWLQAERELRRPTVG